MVISPRVLTALDHRAALTILRAPRGFGKTSTITHWLADRDDVETVRWALDQGANRLEGFWRGLGLALRAAGIDAADREQVLGALAARERPLRLVLDNFHEAGHRENPVAVDDDLLEAVRGNDRLELVVATRSLRTLESSGALSVDVAILRPADLGLEASGVLALAAARGLPMVEEEAHRIVLELGGWPAAIRACLDAALMAGGDPSIDGRLVDGFIQTLLRDLRSSELREFLMRTAVPPEFSAAAANAMVPGGGAVRDLRNLLVSGLLQERDTVAGRRYAYPPAVRDALLRVGSDTRPQMVRDVHRSLLELGAREEGPVGLLRHAVHAEEWPTVLRVLEEDWGLLVSRYQREVLELARELPPHVVGEDSRLGVLTRELARMPEQVASETTWTQARPVFLEETMRIRGEGRPSAADAPLVLFHTAVAEILAGRNDAAIYSFDRVRDIGLVTDDADARLMGAGGLLMANAIAGEVDRALELAADPELGSILQGPASAGLAELAAVGCRIAVAIATADGMTAGRAAAVAQLIEPRRRDELWAMGVYARALHASVDGSTVARDRAAGELRAAMRYLEPGGITRATICTMLAELLIAGGQLEVAEQVLDRLETSPVSLPVRAHLQLAQGRTAQAITLAEESLQDPRATVRARLLAETLIAAGLREQGQLTAARRQFSQAVRTARASGQRRAFRLLPPAVFTELSGGSPELETLRVPGAGQTASGLASDGELPLAGPARPGSEASPASVVLSDREIDVLRALHDHPGPSGVAAELGMSVNTAKTHVRNVYRKLGASSRQEAVRLAGPLLRRLR